MGVVMIKCPGTGHAIPTGMKADRERFRSSPVFFAHLLLDLPGQSRMVCQGGMGSRAEREMAHARGRIRPAIGVEPSRRCNPVNGSLAVGRSFLRRCAPPHFVRVGKQASFSPQAVAASSRPSDDAIDPAAHELVALACRRFEPSSISADWIGLRRRAQLGNDLRHRRPPHAEKFRKRLLGQRQDVPVNPIVDLQQPPRQAGLDRVQRIAGRDVLPLCHQGPGVGLNRAVQGTAAAERRLVSAKSAMPAPPPAPPPSAETATARATSGRPAPSLPTMAVATVCPLGISIMKAIRPLSGEIDPFYWIARPHQHGVPFKLNQSEMTHKQIEVRCRQRS